MAARSGGDIHAGLVLRFRPSWNGQARQGHGKLAQELRELIDSAKEKVATVGRRGTGPVPLVQLKGELSTFLAARYSDIRLSSMVLTPELEGRLQRIRNLYPQTGV
jgi:hypothetical protein